MATEVVSAREAARLIGRNERTVRRWLERDKIEGAYRDESSGEFRVPVSALEQYGVKQESAPQPEVTADTSTITVAEVRAIESEVLTWTERAVRAETQLATIARLAAVEDQWMPPATFKLTVRSILG